MIPKKYNTPKKYLVSSTNIKIHVKTKKDFKKIVHTSYVVEQI